MQQKEEKKGVVAKVLDMIAGSFSHHSAIAGAGMVKTLLSLLAFFKVVDSTSDTY